MENLDCFSGNSYRNIACIFLTKPFEWSHLVRRVGSAVGDMFSHMGFTPPIYECRECGWRERTVLKATNKPTTIKDVVIMSEAKDADFERKRKEKKQ